MRCKPMASAQRESRFGAGIPVASEAAGDPKHTVRAIAADDMAMVMEEPQVRGSIHGDEYDGSIPAGNGKRLLAPPGVLCAGQVRQEQSGGERDGQYDCNADGDADGGDGTHDQIPYDSADGSRQL